VLLNHKHKTFGRLLCLAAIAYVASFVAVARAEPSTRGARGKTSQRPWAKGVSATQQAKARKAYGVGNQAFSKKSYAIALEHYRRAVGFWQHPAIQYNLAQCLYKLGQRVEAYQQLVASLRYGQAPIGAALYQRGLEQRQMLESLVVKVEIVCQQKGAQVFLDGQPLFTAPGRVQRIVMPGKHQVVARKKGFLTVTKEQVFLPGKTARLVVKLSRERVLKRRWSRWKPWLVVGSGLLVAASGAAMWFKAQSDYNDFAQQLESGCPSGCPDSQLPAAAADAKSSGDTFHKIAIAAFAIGGAIAVSGAVLVVLNQPRAVERPQIVPTIGPTSAGLVISGRF
jgi:tetratricopeptide (TPR) repeat protein